MRAVRMSYVAWQDQPTWGLGQIANHIKSRAWTHLDASLINMAVNQAKHLKERPHVIFGSTTLFHKLKWHKGDVTQTREIYKRSRYTGMLLRGSTSDPNGNRKAQLDIHNHQVLIRPKKGVVIPLALTIPAKRYTHLLKLQLLCESHDAYFNIQICDGHVCISFDEAILAATNQTPVIPGRILSMDSNPNYLGVVISDASGVLHKTIIDFKDLNHKHVSSNKKKHEKYQAVKHILALASHYRCESIAVEKLTMPGADHKKGRTFNRLVNNTWHKNLIHNSLRKWCVIRKLKFIEVIAAYSSFVGCVQNPGEFDSIAAAIELNERARKATQHQKYDLLPKSFDAESIPTPWKEMGLAVLLANGITSWKQLYLWCRHSKFSYRVPYKRDMHDNIISRSLCSPRSFVRMVHMHKHQVIDPCIHA